MIEQQFSDREHLMVARLHRGVLQQLGWGLKIKLVTLQRVVEFEQNAG
jgi:hypothetical protein